MTRFNHWTTPVFLGVCVALGVGVPARADDASARQAFDRAAELLKDSKFADAAREFEHAATESDERALADRARLNKGVSELRAGDTDASAATLGALQRSTDDPGVLGAVQYHLGLIEHARAAAMLKPAQGSPDQSPPPGTEQAIQTLRKAERRFRAALESDPSLEDARRNIDLTQRLIAALEEQHKQEKQKQQQQNKNDQKQDQNNTDQTKQDQQKQDQQQQKQSPSEQNKQDQDQKNAQSQSEQGKQDQAKQDQAKQDQAKQDQAKQDQAKQDQAKQGQSKPDQQQGQQGQSGESGDNTNADEKRSASAAQPGKDGKRPFDQTAAQILDKEQREREAILRYLRQLSGQPPKVEKDW